MKAKVWIIVGIIIATIIFFSWLIPTLQWKHYWTQKAEEYAAASASTEASNQRIINGDGTKEGYIRKAVEANLQKKGYSDIVVTIETISDIEEGGFRGSGEVYYEDTHKFFMVSAKNLDDTKPAVTIY